MAYQLYDIPVHHARNDHGNAPSTRTKHAGRTPKPKLMEQVHEAMRARHYSKRTERAYSRWILQFVRYHSVRHPKEMGAAEINTFLTHRNEEFYTDPYNTTE